MGVSLEEEDAYVLMDPVGTPWQGAGLCATARDLARFGEMLRRGGKLNGRRIFDKEVIDEMRKGGDRESVKTSALSFLTGYSYHNQWWLLHNADGAYEAIGVHGQNIHINPAAEMVIVKLSSHPAAALNLTHPVQNRAWAALAKAVRK
jgi:CubicO group peptidase (beta-lactamase class C family)